MPPATKISVSASVRLSTTIALAMIASLTSHCQMHRPAVTASVSSVNTGTTFWRTNDERASPTSSTMHAPAVRAIMGDSASQSIGGPLTVACAIRPVIAAPPPAPST